VTKVGASLSKVRAFLDCASEYLGKPEITSIRRDVALDAITHAKRELETAQRIEGKRLT
jgi:hypothetical protein